MTHLARMRLDWKGIPPSMATSEPQHPFASDLNLVDTYSLHRLLDTSVSNGGSERLRDWLLTPSPDVAVIEKRQALLQELIPSAMFRDRLILNAAKTTQAGTQNVHKKWAGEYLLSWSEVGSETTRIPAQLVSVLAGLSLVTMVLFALFQLAMIPPLWLGTFVVFVALSGWQLRKLGDIFTESLALQAEIRRLRAIFQHLETASYAGHPHLKHLCSPFQDGKHCPSAQLRRVAWITSAASIQRNPVFWIVLNLLIPWDIFFAFQLERSRGDLARTLPIWLGIWYELEALNSLANFADLNPTYTFPVITPGAVLDGTELGHPLIPTAEKVCNDFTLDALGQIVIVTGSNMSGKSSFLRTIGVNLVLAYCGSVVNAEHLQVGLFRVFTCIQVADSVVDGISYFYAEVKRLKALLGALQTAEDMPLLFIIDEIFRGTNNRERLIGSRAYIRALASGNGVGLIATHDLELAQFADSTPRTNNFHFREDVKDGRMMFDYTLRPGPSPTTNALKIMAIEGLPVDDDME